MDYFDIKNLTADSNIKKHGRFVNRLLSRFANDKEVFTEKYFHYDPDLPNQVTNNTHVKLEGYFQTPLYFSHIRDKILKTFSFEGRVSQTAIDYASMVHSYPNATAIHIRRQDYLDPKNKNTHVHPLQ